MVFSKYTSPCDCSILTCEEQISYFFGQDVTVIKARGEFRCKLLVVIVYSLRSYVVLNKNSIRYLHNKSLHLHVKRYRLGANEHPSEK